MGAVVLRLLGELRMMIAVEDMATAPPITTATAGGDIEQRGWLPPRRCRW